VDFVESFVKIRFSIRLYIFVLSCHLRFAEIACLQRDGSFAALKDFNDQCIENQAAEI